GAASRLRRRLLATRPAFFPASVAPVIIGSAWGYRTAGHFDWTVFILALLATLLVHLACNVLNDVGDELTGADRQNEDRIFPYTGGSRFIQNGIMSTAEMTTWGLTLLGLAALPGIALLELRGPMILAFGAVGVLLGVLYSLPRIQLSAHGLGEAAIAIAFGVLPVNGAAWLQSGRIDGASLLISLPVGMWVAAILLMNEVPDRLADARAGKRTLAVRLGMQGTRALYLTLHALACAALLSAGALALVPWWMALLGLTLLPGAWAAAGAVREGTDRARLERGIEATLRLHTAGSILVVLCVMVAAFR
ncbi:MAG TPA: 1,4-dihydroxy-2-naphthoate octaprenyltransferase, partial [Steroidobacteraceae bacterium]|nr:1,4-dihydroxy-2-naphthoate octaprenyltransferase [Steroidobacteraceae bacterium]